MGSPITSWEGAEAYFTGYGGFTPGLILVISIAVVCIAVIVGHRHETHSYNEVDE